MNDISILKEHKSPWGIEGYYVPTNECYLTKPKTFWSKCKNENVIEQYAKSKKDMPAPNHYKIDNDWTKNTKGKFLKGRRITQTDEILAQKKLKMPGPGQYKLPDHKI